ncbi:MAG: GlmU family protein [Flavobacteriales bacterium]
MKNLIFFDAEEHRTLLPLTYTKPVAELRVGVIKISEKWGKIFDLPYSFYTQPYLNELYPMELSNHNLFILGGLLPNKHLVNSLEALPPETCLTHKGRILGAKGAALNVVTHPEQKIEFTGEVKIIKRPWDIFTENGAEIKEDISLLNEEHITYKLENTVVIGDASELFIHPSAKVMASSLNTSEGPIYIGPNTEVMEGVLIRGPFSLGEGSTVKMGAKIYGDTTIGPFSKVGGEVGNSVIQGHSNKGHDGYMGNSVLGEWCNLGADTNTSNLKNNYSSVRVWDYVSESATDTELTFCGLIMGDHSKTGINTMLNTGTLVGIGSNIFGASFPPKFVPSFSWGSGSDFQVHDYEKFFTTATRVMARRNKELSPEYSKMLLRVFTESMKYRS